MARNVRIGMIGVGYWGPNLARNFSEIPGVDLVAIADLEAASLERVRRRFHDVHTTTDYREFFGMDVDAVAIATPPATHYAIAKDCLEHGLHCLIEKPLTDRYEHARDLVGIARQHDLRLMVGHTFEYNPAVREIRRIVQAGELGEVFYVDAVRTNLGLFQLNTDAMWDLAPHDISIINYILGETPVQVSAHGASFVLREHGVNDLVYLHMEYPGGKLASVRVSWLDPNKTRRTTVVGDKKMLVYNDVSSLEKLRVYDKGVDTVPYTDNYGEFQASYRYGDVTIPHVAGTEPLRIECQHFIACIQGGIEPQSDGVSGASVVQTLQAAGMSLREGRPVGMDEVAARAGLLGSAS